MNEPRAYPRSPRPGGANGHGAAEGPPLLAGTARVDITDYDAGPVNDPLFAKVLALSQGEEHVVLITIDAVAIGGIGRIPDDFLPGLRRRLHHTLGIDPRNVFVSASHCHGVVRREIEAPVAEAVVRAWKRREEVRAGAGAGREDRISENRRIPLQNGRTCDSRRAYPLPPDEQVVAAGPIDPEIGILRLDRKRDGRTLAVVYHFACHPIQGVPGGGNTADIPGFASAVIEAGFGRQAAAFFVQGCGGDINPAGYKEVHVPRDAESLGLRLGRSTLQAARDIECRQGAVLRVIPDEIRLPRADLTAVVKQLEQERERLLVSLQGGELCLRDFVLLSLKHGLFPDFPSAPRAAYLHEENTGRDFLRRLDRRNREQLDIYRNNILIMEELVRLQTNLELVRRHHARNREAGMQPVRAELTGVRVGEFHLIGFPGELPVEIGLSIKARSGMRHAYLAGCANGYLWYAPTSAQLANRGHAQEDSDCLLASGWQEIFEKRVLGLLDRLRAAPGI